MIEVLGDRRIQKFRGHVTSFPGIETSERTSVTPFKDYTGHRVSGSGVDNGLVELERGFIEVDDSGGTL